MVALSRNHFDGGVLSLIFCGVMGPVAGLKMKLSVNQFRVIIGPLATDAPIEP